MGGFFFTSPSRKIESAVGNSLFRSNAAVAAWAVTIGVIVVLLGLDLLLATVRPHAVGYKEAAAWSVAYVAVAVVFGLVLADLPGKLRVLCIP